MIKVQFGAKVKDAYGETFTGFIDPAWPMQLRSAATDVPVFEFTTQDEADEFIADRLGTTRPDKKNASKLWSTWTESDEDNEEKWRRFAVVTQA